MSDAPDEYELRYMDADSALARVRQRQAWWLPATVLASATLLIAMMAPLLWRMAQTPGGRSIALVFAAGYALEFLALFPAMIIGHIVRAVVTPTHLRVHIGLRRAEVPLSAITSLSVEPVRWWRMPGSLLGGLRGREQAFVTFGAKHCLRLEWSDDQGRKKTLWAQLDAAPELCALIASLAPGRTGVRVEATGAEEEPAVEEATGAPVALTRTR